MKPDKRLERTKVYVNGKSKEIQKKAFELGYSWESHGKEVIRTDEPFLYFFVNGFILGDRDMDGFIRHQFSEITAAKILAIEPEKIQPEFKPFDKVLVRDKDESFWNCSLFSYYRENSGYPYLTVGNQSWRQCIPFEGNEHLVGTTDKPKEE